MSETPRRALPPQQQRQSPAEQDMMESETPRQQPQPGLGYRGQGDIGTQQQSYQNNLQTFQSNQSQYEQGAATVSAEATGLGQQRAKVSSDISGLNSQVAAFSAEESAYSSEVVAFNMTYGGKQLNPQQYARAQEAQSFLSSEFTSLQSQRTSLLAQENVVGSEVASYNAAAGGLSSDAANLSRQYQLLTLEANQLNAQSAGIAGQQSAVKPATGPFAFIESGAASIYGGFETGAKDVITASGTGGQQLASLIKTGRFESNNAATAQYLNESVFGMTGAQTASEGANILAYTTPGVAVVKGVGEYNAPIQERAFDIGVGALSVVPFAADIAGVTAEAGSTAGRVIGAVGSPIGRTAIGAGLSATGTAVSGGNPTQIGEAALIGGGVSYAGGELAESVSGKIAASAAAGREASGLAGVGLVNVGTEQGPDVLATPEQAKLLGLDVGRAETFPGSQNYYTDRAPFVGNSGQVAIGSEVENVYATTEQAQNLGLSSGPTIGQRVAIGLTGGYESEPLPVGGAGLARGMEIGPQGQMLGAPGGASPSGFGMGTTFPEETQPPIDLFQTRAGGMQPYEIGEGPIPQERIQPTGGQIESNGMNPFLSERANTSSNLPFEDITSQPQPRTGPSGGSSLSPSPGYQGGGVTETVYRLPPGVQSPGQRDLLFEQDFATTQNRASVFTTPGAQGQSPLGQTGFPEFAIFTWPSTGLQQVPGVQIQQSQAQVSAQVQQPSTSFSSFQIQQPSQVQEQEQNTQQIQGFAFEGGFGASPFEGAPSKSGYPFPGFSLRTPPADRRLKGRKTNAYAFGINKNPVGNLLTLGTKAEKFDL